jgi:DMSO/TMAO reductase YedYZ molybdopterin-dependent catalytic subunit
MGLFARKAVKQPERPPGAPKTWPCYYVEGVPTVDPASYRLEVGGLCESPHSLSLEDLRAIPRTVANRRMTCVTGWSLRGDWEGVLVRDVLARVKPFPGATHLKQTSLGGYEETIALRRAIEGGAMLAFGFGGRPLDVRYGGPVRLVVFDVWAYKGAKGLARLELTDHDEVGFWGLRGYSHSAEIEPGQELAVDLATKMRRPGGRETTEY